VQGTSDEIMHLVSLMVALDDKYSQTKIETRIMPIDLDVDSTHNHHEILDILVIRVHNDFMLSFFK
jgi:hypothetical protein